MRSHPVQYKLLAALVLKFTKSFFFGSLNEFFSIISICESQATAQDYRDHLPRVWSGLVTYSILWRSVTNNYWGIQSQIGSPVIQEFCGIWSQQTVVASGGKIPYVFMKMVMQWLWNYPPMTIIYLWMAFVMYPVHIVAFSHNSKGLYIYDRYLVTSI